MTFNYRQAGSWQAAGIKKRENGQWVNIGGSGDRGSGGGTDPGEVSSRFYTDGPPERDGTTYTYPDNFTGSIQDAIHSLSSGDELYIIPDTYSESVEVTSSVSNHITIRSDLELSFNSDGNSTITQDGATISASGTAFRIDNNWLGSDAEIVSPVEEGDRQISVTDASYFSAGDVVSIVEETRPWQMEQAGGGTGADETRELREVESVDAGSDTITLVHSVRQPFPDINANRVSVYDFTVEDIRLSGLRFSGDETIDSSPLMIYSTKNGWFDNIVSENVGNQALIYNQMSFQNRFDGYRVQNGSNYGLSSTNMSTETMVTNASGYNHNRYVVRLGPTSNSASGLYADTVYGEVNGRTVVNCHDGGYHYEAYNVTAVDSQCATPRSRYFTLDGFEKRGLEGPDIVLAQLPIHVDIRNGYIHNKAAGDPVFAFRMHDAESSPRGDNGDEYFDDVLFENIEIEDYDISASDLGYFEIEGNPAPSGSVTFHNVTLGGVPLERSDVTSWSGYDSNYIQDLTVISD